MLEGGEEFNLVEWGGRGEVVAVGRVPGWRGEMVTAATPVGENDNAVGVVGEGVVETVVAENEVGEGMLERAVKDTVWNRTGS